MNDLKDRCSHDPKTYRYNCILCVRNDLEDAKHKIKELEDVIKKAIQFNVKIDNGYGRDDTYMDVLRQGELLAIALKDKP